MPNNPKENYEEDRRHRNSYSLQYLFIWILFAIWAFVLAMTLDPGPQKIQNIFLAILCPPIYIIAHYLGTNK
jgi:hypothetical protein